MEDAASETVLVFSPRGRNAVLTRNLLEANGLEVRACVTSEELLAGMRAGAGCAIVTSDVLDNELVTELGKLLAAQPAWSDFPIIALVDATPKVQRAGIELGNVTMLEPPIAPATLLAAVRSALRGRRRQYAARAAIWQRDQFLAMLGHELRNPLGAITLASETLPAHGGDIAVLEKRIALIARQANHLAKIVDDLLDVARITSGKVQLRREAVDVDATIRACIEALEARARERETTFVVAGSARSVIEADSGRLEQVITNLLTNAIKYSPRGRTVTITSEEVGAYCEIRVRDQGIGIAPDMLPRVFELFAQADASLDRSEGGMGIGLALVERLVKLHGGEVSVTSAGVGHGSEFTVRLPAGAPLVEAAASVAIATVSDRPLRVVIVDDNYDLLEMTQLAVEAFGCETAIASDGEQGLACILACTPDLALVDIGLPKLDGYAVAQTVRQRLLHPPTLVAITGYGQRNDRERALASGFDEHVTKPIRSETLQRLVETARARSHKA